MPPDRREKPVWRTIFNMSPCREVAFIGVERTSNQTTIAAMWPILSLELRMESEDHLMSRPCGLATTSQRQSKVSGGLMLF
jgi:hypothetical protein